MAVKDMSRLMTFAYEADEAVRGDAFRQLQETAAKERQEGNIENLREILRRLLWSMNDESGGVGWFSAEAAAAIMIGVPELIDEYGILLTSFMNMFPFEASVHRAIARVAAVKPGYFRTVAGNLAESLGYDDPAVRAAAAAALISIDKETYTEKVKSLLNDSAVVTGYDYSTGKTWEKTVAEVAGEILEQ